MSDRSFECRECGKTFTVKAEVLAKYPGWAPGVCLDCRDRSRGGARPAGSGRSSGGRRSPQKGRPAPAAAPGPAAVDPEALEAAIAKAISRHSEGPKDGLFADGACSGNPGPGGWAVVRVENDVLVDRRSGFEPRTTNNRMELTALVNAYELLPQDAKAVIWSDSNLCVRTINEWAAGWERLGWKRRQGPVENLDLVQRVYALDRAHPKVELRWIPGHSGWRWNEVADVLATAPLRPPAKPKPTATVTDAAEPATPAEPPAG